LSTFAMNTSSARHPDPREQFWSGAGRRRRRTERPACPRGSPGASPTNIQVGGGGAGSRRRPASDPWRARAFGANPRPRRGTRRGSGPQGSVAATAAASTAAASSRTRSSVGGALRAVGPRKTENCFCTFDCPQSGQARGLVVTDELLEVRFAAHADVFVDRHSGGKSTRRDGPDTGAEHRTAPVSLWCPVIREELEPIWRPLQTIAELRSALCRPCRDGRTIASCPTMGALHEGPSRPDRGRPGPSADAVVASLFVNPAQFGEAADLEGVPARPLAHDERVAAGCRRRRAVSPRPPTSSTPRAFASWVHPRGSGRRARGRAPPRPLPRPSATVCVKLFELVRPHVAYFGRKDAQQARRHQAGRARPEHRHRDQWRRDRAPTTTASRSPSRKPSPLLPTSGRRALAIPRGALATCDAERARELLEEAGDRARTTWRSPTSTARRSQSLRASARLV